MSTKPIHISDQLVSCQMSAELSMLGMIVCLIKSNSFRLFDLLHANVPNGGLAIHLSHSFPSVRVIADFHHGCSESRRSSVRWRCESAEEILSSVISEDMVKDGYEDITNIDISSVAIDMMKKKYAHVTQLKYMQMDVRDMSYFLDESFDNVIDKGTFDSLMCGINARISVSSMLNEVSRLLRPGGLYILITYGDPTVRISHFKSGRGWKILLYILPRPGFHTNSSCSPYLRSLMEPVHFSERGMLPSDFVLDDPESHYIYVCQKIQGLLSSEDEETPTT